MRQSVVGPAQERQVVPWREAMQAAWCWDVMRLRQSMKAVVNSGLAFWEGDGEQRKVGRGWVWWRWVVSWEEWMVKRKMAGVVSLVVVVAMMVWCGCFWKGVRVGCGWRLGGED